jgi:RNA-binding protein
MLTSKQRAYLRGLANPLETIGQVGKEGVSPAVIETAALALKARELIKMHVLDTAPVSAREACTQLSAALAAEPVQVIGSRFVLYKPNPQKRVIELPAPPKNRT